MPRPGQSVLNLWRVRNLFGRMGFVKARLKMTFLEGSVLVEAISAPEVRASGGGEMRKGFRH